MRNLNITLAEFQQALESGETPYQITRKQIQVMHQFDEALRATGILDTTLKPGLRFPEFALSNQYETSINLGTLLERGPAVLSFFRGMWCPYCNLELQALQKSHAEIESTGATLIGISPQLPSVNKRMAYQNKIRFDILSDSNNTLADKIGLGYDLSEDLINEVFKKLGAVLPDFNGEDSWRLPISSRFIIDSDGVIVSANADVNFRKRTDPSETIAILKAITRRTRLNR